MKKKGIETLRPVLPAVRQAVTIFLFAVLAGTLVNHLRANSLPLFDERSAKAPLPPQISENIAIPFEKAEALFPFKIAIFLDARSPELYEQAHIKGARNLPAESFKEYFSRVMGGISKETVLVVYCDGETPSPSKALAVALFSRGFTKIRTLEKGWTLWLVHELPIEAGPSPDGFQKG